MPARPDPKDLAVQLWLRRSLGHDFDPVLAEPIPADLASLLRELTPGS